MPDDKLKKILAAYNCKKCGAFTTEGVCKECWGKLLELEQQAYGVKNDLRRPT